MRTIRLSLNILGALMFLIMATSMAQAQATRTWVSGVGDDVNPCSRTAPCKTFAGAISKTAAGGEISVLDPGGYGAVTITKSMTIDGEGTLASILASSVNGVNVNDSATATPGTIVVTLRNLTINGAPPTSPGLNGINFTSGRSLNVEDCDIFGFNSAAPNGNGINVNLTQSAKEVFVKDTNIHNCRQGARLTTSAASGFVVGTFDNVRIDHVSGDGVRLETGGNVDLRDSVISFATGTGLNITGAAPFANATVIDSTIVHCGTGLATGSATTRLTHSSILQNAIGISFAGGAVRSAGDNFIDSNTTQFSGGALTPAPLQ